MRINSTSTDICYVENHGKILLKPLIYDSKKKSLSIVIFGFFKQLLQINTAIHQWRNRWVRMIVFILMESKAI